MQGMEDFSLAPSEIRDNDEKMNKLLVPVDFSDGSAHLLEVAEAEARTHGAALVLLHVIEPAAEVAGFETDPEMMRLRIGQDLEQEERIEVKKLQALAEGLRAKGVSCDTLVKFGLPADEVLSAVKKHQADFVVMGSHGHGALYHLFTGSVVNGVLRQIDVPVLVVPLRQKAG